MSPEALRPRLDAMADKTQSADTCKRFEALGWDTFRIDGHDLDADLGARVEDLALDGEDLDVRFCGRAWYMGKIVCQSFDYRGMVGADTYAVTVQVKVQRI